MPTITGVSQLVGQKGEKGDPGTGITFIGDLADTGLLPADGNTNGDTYYVDPDFWSWDGTQWVNVGPMGQEGPQGDPGPAGPEGDPGIGVPPGGAEGQVLSKATASDYDTEWAYPESGDLPANPGFDYALRGGSPNLIFGRVKDAFLNDRADIDKTGVADMSAAITTYLSEYLTAGIRNVYCESGSTYKVLTTVSIPGGLHLIGPHAEGWNSNTGGATFKAGASGISVISMNAGSSHLVGITIDMGSTGGFTGNVGVTPNQHYQTIQRCVFMSGDATSTGVKGGHILYFGMYENMFRGSVDGRSVDLLETYGTIGGYYGVNVGWFQRNSFAGDVGAFRAHGIFEVAGNDFEAGSGSSGPAIELVGDSTFNASATVEDNYFESGSSGATAIKLNGSAVYAKIRGNDILYGQPGSIGITAASRIAGAEIVGNSFRTETGIDMSVAMTDSNNPGILIAGNRYQCTTPIASVATSAVGKAYIQDPVVGHRFHGGSHFYHDMELDGALNHDGTTAGFFNTTPVTKRTLAAAATDAATTQTLANSLRQALIDLGLGS